MIRIRPAAERGHFDHGWLDTWHTFSFSDYYDPEYMGFRDLRVINEDRVQEGEGFGKHPHKDMEILTYILAGALEHKDSMGNGSVIRPGDMQYMSAGSGVFHSEFNHSQTERVHLLQIWILPSVSRATPRYDQKHYPVSERLGQLRLVASPDGAEGSIAIRQDVRLYASILDPGQTVDQTLAPRRHGWLQVARGELELNGLSLKAGDGAALSAETALNLRSTGTGQAEFLYFDLR